MPALRLAQFSQNVSRARDLVGLGQSIGNMTHGLVDSSDLYRYGLVQAVAALDAYVHGVVLDRAVDVLLGRLPSSTASPRVGLDISAVQQLLAAASPADQELAARTHVAQRLARETFQRPDDVASAFAMVGVSKVWSTAFPSDPSGSMTQISLVVDRRNRIVHSCDIDPVSPATVTPLSDADALSAIDTVEATVLALDRVC